MVQSPKCIEALNRCRVKKATAKAKRLLKNHPKHMDEKYMNKAQHKAYIERYLVTDGNVVPTLDQTKISLQMYKEMARQDENASDEAAILLIIEKADAYAKQIATDSTVETD